MGGVTPSPRQDNPETKPVSTVSIPAAGGNKQISNKLPNAPKNQSSDAFEKFFFASPLKQIQPRAPLPPPVITNVLTPTFRRGTGPTEAYSSHFMEVSGWVSNFNNTTHRLELYTDSPTWGDPIEAPVLGNAFAADIPVFRIPPTDSLFARIVDRATNIRVGAPIRITLPGAFPKSPDPYKPTIRSPASAASLARYVSSIDVRVNGFLRNFNYYKFPDYRLRVQLLTSAHVGIAGTVRDLSVSSPNLSFNQQVTYSGTFPPGIKLKLFITHKGLLTHSIILPL